jgi:hypothetical protein
MRKRIHVNQHVIRANRRSGRNDAPISVKTYNANVKAHRVTVDGPSVVVYSPDKPLACGARLWVETESRVVAFDEVARTETELR